jgi:hypothetical protein
MTSISEQIVAEVEREIELMEAERAATVAALERRGRRGGGTVVLSVRLDATEVDELERRAERVGIRPSVLARNLIRKGLGSPTSIALEDVVARLDRAMDDLRALSAARLRVAGE